MAERKDIEKTLDATKFGSSLKDLEEGDLTRGYSAAGVDGDYEFAHLKGEPAAGPNPMEVVGYGGDSAYYREKYGDNLADFEDDKPNDGAGYMNRAGRGNRGNVGRN